MTKRRQSGGVRESLLRSTPRSDSIRALRETISGLVDLDANELCLQWRDHSGGNPPAHLPRWLLLRILAYRIHLLIVAAPTKQTASSCEPVAPEQPIAPISLPSSIKGIPPREAIMSSSVS